MSKIVLNGYRYIEKRWPVYTLDTESRKVETLWFASQPESETFGPKCGFGDFRYFGKRFARVKGFFALYADGASLYLWLDEKSYDLIHDDVSIHRGLDLMLRKRFRVYADGVLVFDCRYFYSDGTFPDEDIFSYIARCSKSIESRFHTLLLWQDTANGTFRATDEYMKDLNERVKSTMG
ncbi:MAG: hypothetical protein HQK56_02535 [Deltaproteobacteria bacterium]|nr:hypothetical protein [Deltaproteobacteria bacterium]